MKYKRLTQVRDHSGWLQVKGQILFVERLGAAVEILENWSDELIFGCLCASKSKRISNTLGVS